MARVLVAMSGGVDSSLAAVLLQEQGYEVAGATMLLWQAHHKTSQHAADDAAHLCQQRGIPHITLDYQAIFRQHVVDYFVTGYCTGTTPNPCLACNQHIKFHQLFHYARSHNYDYLATGHYAMIGQRQAEYTLLRGADRTRDQSYVLYMLQQEHLAHLLFPLGAFVKNSVRSMAHDYRLDVADRPESQDICFIPNRKYRDFINTEQPDAFIPGPILDQEGREIGQHQGLPRYTVGQRKGLSLSSTHQLFVTAIDNTRNALIVGTAEQAQCARFVIDDVRIVSEHPITTPFDCTVQIRAHATPVAAKITPLTASRMHIVLEQPLRDITPGQAAVLYDNTEHRVIAGGIIIAHHKTERYLSP